MDVDKLKMMKELLDTLIDEMDYGKDDFKKRLGRNMEPEAELDISELEAPLDEEESEIESSEEDYGDMIPEESPEDKFKKRLMKLRE